MKGNSKHWIEDMNMKKGAERKTAQSKGMSTEAYAESTDNSKNPRTKRRAILTETPDKVRGKK